MQVADAAAAYAQCTAHGGTGVLPPVTLKGGPGEEGEVIHSIQFNSFQ